MRELLLVDCCGFIGSLPYVANYSRHFDQKKKERRQRKANAVESMI
ncbi:hypothetical protein [Planococcus kocurii]|nr:hypothetical protein [Planococcus kocurii]